MYKRQVVFTLIYFSQRIIQRRKILEGIEKITQGDIEYKLELKEYQGDEYLLAEGINHIGEGLALSLIHISAFGGCISRDASRFRLQISARVSSENVFPE